MNIDNKVQGSHVDKTKDSPKSPRAYFHWGPLQKETNKYGSLIRKK